MHDRELRDNIMLDTKKEDTRLVSFINYRTLKKIFKLSLLSLVYWDTILLDKMYKNSFF